jgi:GrpB-like predicted nucleotidyltransferase (UPF0157 family)
MKKDYKPIIDLMANSSSFEKLNKIHLILEGEERWEKQLLFRDRLRENAHLVEEYKNLKLKLAQLYSFICMRLTHTHLF